MKLLLITCCDSCFIDAITNRVSIVNVMEGFQSISFPIMVPQLTMVTFLERQASEPPQVSGHAEMTLDGSRIVLLNIDLNFQNKLVTRAIGLIQGIPIAGPGQLKAAFTVQGVELGAWYMNVTQLPSPTSATTTSGTPPASGTPRP
jgi:hypothetical protein